MTTSRPTNSDWLREMVSHAIRPEVGAVGARLWYPDGRLQHAGVVLGLHGVARHAFQRFLPQPVAPMNRTFVLSQNYSAVTAACMVLRKTVFDDVGGFDENLPNNFNDVDFCLRLRERGWQIIWTPYADLIHQESASRGRHSGSAERAQLLRDMAYLQEKWGEQLQNDPFYSPNLSDSDAFTLAWPPRIPPLRKSLKSARRKFLSPRFRSRIRIFRNTAVVLLINPQISVCFDIVGHAVRFCRNCAI